MAQLWTPLGVTLGNLVYSLPLAPGEQQLVAIFERREETAIFESETLSVSEQQAFQQQQDTSARATFDQAFSESAQGGKERFTTVLAELAGVYGKHVWMLVKPTITLMLLASVVSAALLVFIPWDSLLSQVTPLRMALASLLSVFMPVPIALDVMFAAQLQRQGVPAGYVMLFAMTLGTYSIIPSIYLSREVSKTLAVSLFVFFLVTGWVLGMVF